MTMKRYELIAQALEQVPTDAIQTLVKEGLLMQCHIDYPKICKDYDVERAKGRPYMAAIRETAEKNRISESYAKSIIAKFAIPVTA